MLKLCFLSIISMLIGPQLFAEETINDLRPKVPSYLKGLIHQNIIYLDDAKKVKSCPSGFIWDRENFNNIVSLVKKTSFDPHCIWDTIDKNARHYVGANRVIGFSFGTVLEASLGVGANIGTELIFMPWGQDALMVGMVRFEGGSFSLSLSGGSRSQSVIYGRCKNNIFGYLGLFQSKAALAMMENIGVKRLWGKKTGCNSITSIRGATSPIAGVALSIYNQVGKFAIVKGPGVHGILNYISSLNYYK